MFFEGSLLIRSIPGRFGNFNVGVLSTAIGQFTVKDSIIEEYEAGRYEGQFDITQIYPKSYFTNGRLIVENRARVVGIVLANADESTEPAVLESVDIDPIVEDIKSLPTPTAEVTPASALDPAASIESEPTTVSDDASEPTTDTKPMAGIDPVYGDLFGSLWPLADQVKLDPTVDRTRFRSQRDALKQLGYQFQPMGQIWLKAA